jgi:hypothetical protein
MNEPTKYDARETTDEAAQNESDSESLLDWQTPAIEDVSEQVMAQPYIRFT